MCGGGRGFDCSGSGVDRVVVRAIPDKADGSAEMGYPMFEDQAAAPLSEYGSGNGFDCSETRGWGQAEFNYLKVNEVL